MMYCLAGGSLGWVLGPLSFFSLRRIGNSTNNRHIKNEEKREPINVIFNINVQIIYAFRILICIFYCVLIIM